MKKTAILLVLAGALALPALAQTPNGGGAAAGARAVRDADVRAYRLGPEDLIEIQVFEVEGLDREVRVQQDGSIIWNPVGKVQVEGLTIDELIERLTQLLKSKWVNDPQVTIQIKDFRSKMASVIGAVTNPGRYPVIGRKNLVEMISEAGGVTPRAGDEIVILRDGPNGGGTSTITIDLRELSEAGNPELNILIEPNDVISVPIDREFKVFVTGRVNNPGSITVKMSEGITLMQAIAGAGGVAAGAKQGGVTVKRLDKSGKETRIKVDLRDILRGKKVDIRLQEGDVVYVPESFW